MAVKKNKLHELICNGFQDMFREKSRVNNNFSTFAGCGTTPIADGNAKTFLQISYKAKDRLIQSSNAIPGIFNQRS